MTAIVQIEADHFTGQQNIAASPVTAERDLAKLIIELQAQQAVADSHVLSTSNPHTVTLAQLGLDQPFDYKGSVTLAADFPTAAAVETGWFYTVAGNVTDNDATKTNTGLSFIAGDEIVWDGTTWVTLGRAKPGNIVHEQAVAATLTSQMMIAPAGGSITSLQAFAGTAAAAGESMTVDVTINGVTALSAVATIDDAATTTVVEGTIDAAANDFVRGDVIAIVRTYVAGGGPTPMADTVVSVAYELN
jgi:hypothetical protein